MERMLISLGAVKMCATGLVLIISLFNCIIMNVRFLLPLLCTCKCKYVP